jgi:uncharacterized membrane protein HdeD (DUF308 family)
MISKDKTMPWWFILLTGLVILAAGIYLLVSQESGLSVLTFLLAVGVLFFCVYNFFKAYKFKDDNRLFVPFIVHALLDLVLFLLIIIIKNSYALLGVILSSWFIIFGLFGIINARQDGGNSAKTRVSALLLLVGIVLILLPFLLSINHVLFLGIVAILIGVIRSAQGIIVKVQRDGRTSGGRSNLI